jgi:hypothetical protein
MQRTVPGKYVHQNREELARPLEARDRRDAAVNGDFKALDLVPGLGGGFSYPRQPPDPARWFGGTGPRAGLEYTSIGPFTGVDFLQARGAESALSCVPRFTAALVPARREAMSRTASAALYSCQLETLRRHIRAAHVEHGAIPERPARRFQPKA